MSECVEYADGSKEWYRNGELHREDGPAVERPSGYKAWYVNGNRHKVDGPAVEYPDGREEYFMNGIECLDVLILVEEEIL